MAIARYSPTYSHGGPSAPGFPSVSGTVTGAGRPITVFGAIESCAMWVALTAGTATVKIEANGGALDSTSNPPSDEWVDQSNGGFTMGGSDPLTIYKLIPANRAPFWRTNITAISGGGTISSGISQIIVSSPTGPACVAAAYPKIESSQNPNQ